MQKTCLLALFTLNVLAPKVWAQDDDAELGKVQAEPSELGDSSIVDDTDSAPGPGPTYQAKAQPSNAAPALAQQPPTPEAAPSATTPTAIDPATEPGFLDGRRRPAQTFGLTLARPTQIGEYNHYDYLYGSERLSPGFYGGYYLYSYFVDLGIVGRFSYYHDEGHPLAKREGLTFPYKGDLSTQEKDNNQKLALTMMPVQIAAEAAIAPFKTRWLVLRAWMGFEYLYVSESVSPDIPASATPSDTASAYTSSGWNQGVATGFMASFSMTGFDARSDKSLQSIGVDRSYLSFFIENVRTTKAKFGNFDRKNYGIAFSFEGLR